MYFVTVTELGEETKTYVFYSQAEMEEFASCVSSEYPDAIVQSGQTNEATDLFESWSF